MALLTINSKMKKSAKGKGLKIVNFTLPALVTCPNAGACSVGCYARQGTYLFSNVKAKHQANLIATKDLKSFEAAIKAELLKIKPTHVRIHDAGDFYSLDYFKVWVKLAEAHPAIVFYAYTKQVLMVKQFALQYGKSLPIKIVFSYGGKQDQSINKRADRHSKVFSSIEELQAAGYVIASNDDMEAIGDNPKIGLVYHGQKGYEKTNWQKVS